MGQTFGDVRALIHHPSPTNWKALIAALCVWPDPQELRQIVLPYCEQSLAAWPDMWRHASPGWINDALADREVIHPGVWLARSLAFAPKKGRNVSWLRLWDHYDLSCVTTLRFHGRGAKLKLPRHDFERMFDALKETPVRALRFYDTKLNPAQWKSVMAWPGLNGLESLSLNRCRLSSYQRDVQLGVSLFELAGHECHALRHLCVRDNRLRGSDLALLAEASFAKRLRTLRFGATPTNPYSSDSHAWFNRAGRDGLEALCHPNAFPALESLELSYQQFNADTIAPLHNAEMKSLRHLDLHQNYLLSPEGKALAHSSFIRRLEALDLSGNEIGAQATQELCDAFEGGALRTLHLNRAKVGISGAAHMMRAEGLEQLTQLGFADNDLHGEGMKIFTHCALSRLEHLNMMRNTMTDETYADFLCAPFLSTLKTLKIPTLTDAQVIELLEHPNLQQLERLAVDSRRDERNAALAAHEHGHKLTFLRQELYHYLNYTPLLIPLPGLDHAAPR